MARYSSLAMQHVEQTLEHELGSAWTRECEEIWLTRVGQQGRDLPQIKLGLEYENAGWGRIAEVLLRGSEAKIPDGLFRGHDPEEIASRAPLLGMAIPRHAVDLRRWMPPGGELKPSISRAMCIAFAPIPPREFWHAITWSKALAEHLGHAPPKMPDNPRLTDIIDISEFIYRCHKAEIGWGLKGSGTDEREWAIALGNACSADPKERPDLTREWRVWSRMTCAGSGGGAKRRIGERAIRDASMSAEPCGMITEEVCNAAGQVTQIEVAWGPWGSQRMATLHLGGIRTTMRTQTWAQLMPSKCQGAQG